MTNLTKNRTRRYMQMLTPLDSEMKLAIINQLSASMLKNDKPKRAGLEIFDGITGAWNDDISPEEDTSIFAAE